MFSFIFTATQTAGALGGIGWLAEKMAKFAKWATLMVTNREARKLWTSGKKETLTKAFTTKGSTTESGGEEGDPPPARPEIVDHEMATVLLNTLGLSKKELVYMGQAGTKLSKA
jgi:hypothetical protein